MLLLLDGRKGSIFKSAFKRNAMQNFRHILLGYEFCCKQGSGFWLSFAFVYFCYGGGAEVWQVAVLVGRGKRLFPKGGGSLLQRGSNKPFSI